jgi:hypothetical protein
MQVKTAKAPSTTTSRATPPASTGAGIDPSTDARAAVPADFTRSTHAGALPGAAPKLLAHMLDGAERLLRPPLRFLEEPLGRVSSHQTEAAAALGPALVIPFDSGQKSGLTLARPRTRAPAPPENWCCCSSRYASSARPACGRLRRAGLIRGHRPPPASKTPRAPALRPGHMLRRDHPKRAVLPIDR